MPSPAKRLFLILLNNLLKPLPVDFFKPEDIIFIPTMNTAAPTNKATILNISFSVSSLIRYYLKTFIYKLQRFTKKSKL